MPAKPVATYQNQNEAINSLIEENGNLVTSLRQAEQTHTAEKAKLVQLTLHEAALEDSVTVRSSACWRLQAVKCVYV